MNHSPAPPEEPNLFDLPLQGPAERSEEAVPDPPVLETARPARRPSRRSAPETLPLFQTARAGRELELETLPPAPPPDPEDEPQSTELESRPAAPGPRPRLVETIAESGRGVPAALRPRFKAATADLLVFAAVASLQLAGTARLGIALRSADWPAYAACLLAFTYLYSVISLAFWGQTPGMVWAGILARSRDAEPLAFGQTSRRWLGGLLTVAFAGVPGLFALRGRSFADWISSSRTVSIDEPVA